MIFDGQNCRNLELVPKILSTKKFYPPKYCPKVYYNLDPLHHTRLLSCAIGTSILCYTPPLRNKLTHPPVNEALLPDKCGSILHDFFLSTCNSRTSPAAGAQFHNWFHPKVYNPAPYYMSKIHLVKKMRVSLCGMLSNQTKNYENHTWRQI